MRRATWSAARVSARAAPRRTSSPDAFEKEIQACVGQPFGESADHVFVVVVEMRTGGEQLDRVESVRRYMHEVLPRQPRLVKQVRRYAKTMIRQITILQGFRF